MQNHYQSTMVKDIYNMHRSTSTYIVIMQFYNTATEQIWQKTYTVKTL